MKRTAKVGMWSVVACFVFGTMLTTVDTAQARLDYCKAFITKYDKVKDAKTAKCTICHGKKKEVRNNYGEAFGKALAAKKEKDKAKIEAALKKVEAEKSATEGKTFGDLLKDGKLPGVKKE